MNSITQTRTLPSESPVHRLMQRLITCLVLILTGTGFAEIAQAQSAEDPSGAVLEEIVVTARKFKESLQEVPVSVTAFSAESLEKLRIENISQISTATPGLTFDSSAAISGSRVSSSIFIRGIGQTDFTLVSDPGVGLYLDGVYIGRSVGGVLDVIDVESVEVLRGPQGTLFGKNTIGGAISIISKRPADEFRGYVDVTVGNDSRRDIKASIDVPISDSLRSRFTFAALNQDGYVKNLGGGPDLNDTDARIARAIFSFAPGENFEATLSLDWTDRNEQAQAQRLLAYSLNSALPTFAIGAAVSPTLNLDDYACLGSDPVAQSLNASKCDTPHVTYSGSNTPSLAEVFGSSLTLTYDFGPLQLKSITGYRDMEAVFARDTDNSPVIIVETIDTMEHEQLSQEIQLTGMTERLKWLIGYYYFEEDGFNRNDVITPFFYLKSGGDVDNNSNAYFGQITFYPTNNLSLTAGVRRTSETKRFLPDQWVNIDLDGSFTTRFLDDTLQHSRLDRGDLPIGTFAPIGAPVGEFDLVPSVLNKEDFDETTGLLSVDYKLNEELMLYARYATGFKSGGFNQRIGPPGLPEPLRYEPETSASIELGWKWMNAAKTVRLNGSVFQTAYDDLQINVFAGVAPTTLNATEAEIRGGEAELTVAVTEALTVNANISILDPEYTKVGPASPVTKATPFPKTPDFTAFVGADYARNVGAGILNFHFDWSYRDKVYNNTIASPEIKQKAFDMINAGITYALQGWEISLFGRNLTDEIYLITGNYELPGFGYSEGVYSNGREWALSLRYNF